MRSGMQTINILDLEVVTGGGSVRAPLSGDVTQQINTNWGGTQIINPPPAPPKKPSGLRIDYLREHPEARWGAPPYVNRPVRR